MQYVWKLYTRLSRVVFCSRGRFVVCTISFLIILAIIPLSQLQLDNIDKYVLIIHMISRRNSNSQRTLHIWPSMVRYGVSLYVFWKYPIRKRFNNMNTRKKIDLKKTVCTFPGTHCVYWWPWASSPNHVLRALTMPLPATGNKLTHWSRDKMAAISQTTLPHSFSWMKMLEFRFKFHWSLFLRVRLTTFQHWFR